jgi:uncharacterized metal-binding protein YceD (DUF177 family)
VQSTGDAVILAIPLAALHQPAGQKVPEPPQQQPTPHGMPAR